MKKISGLKEERLIAILLLIIGSVSIVTAIVIIIYVNSEKKTSACITPNSEIKEKKSIENMESIDSDEEIDNIDDTVISQYQKYIDEKCVDGYAGCRFAYIDDDNVPELIIKVNSKEVVLQYKNDKINVYECNKGNVCRVFYQERKSNIVFEDRVDQPYECYFYSIGDNEMKLRGSCYYNNDPFDSKYYVGEDKEVELDEYIDYIESFGNYSRNYINNMKNVTSAAQKLYTYRKLSEKKKSEIALSYFYENEIDNNEYTMYEYIDINKDGIMEMIAYGTCEAYGNIVCNYYNDRVYRTFLRRSSFEIIGDMIDNCGGHMNCYFNYIYKIVDGRMTLIAEGDYYAAAFEKGDYYLTDLSGDDIEYIYWWNDEKVSEEEYYDILSSYYRKKQVNN